MSRTTHRHSPVKGTPDSGCDYGEFQSPALWSALDGIRHYHETHTTDKITRFRDFDDKKPKFPNLLILVVSDPEWIARLQEFTDSEFPKDGE